ncbi:MAG: hypothetical protein MJ199_00660, partial [Bacilli bacterium]|nr:hypothetical protein [Bacilli bacterium]
GRSGRQGDPGFSRFYVSLDDELMKRFANERMVRYFEGLGTEALESSMVMNVITGAQKQIEGKNFDIRKNLLDYDDVLAKQREIIYGKRDKILFAQDIGDIISDFFQKAGSKIANKSVDPNNHEKLIKASILEKELMPRFLPENAIKVSAFNEAPVEEAAPDLTDVLFDRYLKRRKEWGKEIADQVERQITLQTLDQGWMKHIDAMASFREGIHLRGYANTNPLQDYVNEGYQMFREMLDDVSLNVVHKLLNVIIHIKTPEEIAKEKEELEKKKAEAMNAEVKDKKE